MDLLRQAGVTDMTVWVDLGESAMFFELQNAWMKVVDGWPVSL